MRFTFYVLHNYTNDRVGLLKTAKWEHKNDETVLYSLRLSRICPDFVPRIGQKLFLPTNKIKKIIFNRTLLDGSRSRFEPDCLSLPVLIELYLSR
jgi:hypothetical protein